MPTTPTYGNFQVSPTTQGFEGTRHRDYTGDAPNLNKELGRNLEDLAGYAMKQRDLADEARVQDKLTQLRRYATQRRLGENGFLTLHGENALKPDDEGQDLASREEAALISFGEDLAQDLTPRQRALFGRQSQAIHQQQYGFAQQHFFNESEAYRKTTWTNVGANAVETATASYQDFDVLDESIDQSRLAAVNLADMEGLDENGRNLAIKTSIGNTIIGAVNGALAACEKDPTQVRYAVAILDRYGDQIPAGKLLELRRLVNGQTDANTKYELSRLGLEALDRDPGTMALAYGALNGEAVPANKRKGANIAVFGHMINVESGGRQFETDPDGRSVTLVGRYADGTIPKNEEERAYGKSQIQVRNAKVAAERLKIDFDMKRFKEDALYNEALGQEFFSMLVEQNGGDMQKAVAAYHSGQGNVNKAVKAAEKDGKPWIEHLGPEGQQYVAKVMKSFEQAQTGSVTDASGNTVSPNDPRYAQMSRRWATRQQMEDWVMANNTRAAKDYKFRDEVVDEMMRRQAQARADYVQEQENLMAEANDLILQGQQVPQSLWSRMNRAQQEAVMETRRKLAANDTSGDIALAMKATGDPTWWISLSQSAMKNALVAMPAKYRDQLEAQWYKDRQTSAQAADEQARNNIMLQRGQVNPAFSVPLNKAGSLLESAMRASGTWPEDKDAQAFLTMQLQQYLTLQAQGVGVQLKEDSQILPHINEWLQSSVIYDGMFETAKPIWKLEVSDFPARAKTNAIEIVRQAVNNERAAKGYVGEATEGEVIAKMQDVLFNRNVQLTWTGPDGKPIEFDAVTRGYLERKAGRKLSLSELLRAQAQMELTGERVPEGEFATGLERDWANAEGDSDTLLSGYRFNLDGGDGQPRDDL